MNAARRKNKSGTTLAMPLNVMPPPVLFKGTAFSHASVV
jgi:hypothetical protein